jgi:hypothetical protein
MKLRKKKDGALCCAARCKIPPEYLHTQPDGEHLWWCAQHSAEASVGAATPAEQIGTGEILSPAQLEELQRTQADAERDLAELQEIQISTMDEAQFGEDERRKARDAIKAWESKRTEATGPLNKSLKTINGWFRPTVEALKALEGAWTRSLNAYRARVVEEQRALLEAARLEQVAQAEEQERAARAQAEAERFAREAEAAHAAGEAGIANAKAEQALAADREAQEVARAAAARPAAVREALVLAAETKPGTADTYIDNWKFEVVDASQVPREYLSPDLAKIGAVVKSLKDACVIPGVRVYNEPYARSKRTDAYDRNAPARPCSPEDPCFLDQCPACRTFPSGSGG